MLGNVSNDNLITGNSLNHNENIQSIEKNGNSKNPYAKTAEFDDSLEISKEAKELLQKEKDIEHFKSLVLTSPLNNEELNSIMKLIQKGEFIDNKDLANAMSSDKGLLSHLLQKVDAAS